MWSKDINKSSVSVLLFGHSDRHTMACDVVSFPGSVASAIFFTPQGDVSVEDPVRHDDLHNSALRDTCSLPHDCVAMKLATPPEEQSNQWIDEVGFTFEAAEVEQ